MIYIYLKASDASGTPREVAERQSCEARDMLRSALKSLSLPDAEIIKDGRGKPYFAAEGYPAVSISHTEGAVAVALATECPAVGVDIERHSPRLSDTRVAERFFRGLSYQGCECFDIKIITDGVTAPAEDCAATRFTLGEAIIKCDGGGFAASAEATALAKKMEKSSYTVTLGGEKYSLSVAVKRKEK